MERLASVWAEDSTEKIRAGVRVKIGSFVEGNLERASEILCALLDIARKDKAIPVPVDSLQEVSSLQPCILFLVCLLQHQDRAVPQTPYRWDSLTTALIKSVRTGVFFDKKCWARNRNILKPLYFSSIIMEDKAHELGKCELKFIFRGSKALSIPSGEVSQGQKPSLRRSRGRCLHRERL